MKKQYTAEEKKAYYAEQKKAVEESLVNGVKTCYTSGNFRHYLDTISQFHSYSINNCMLIAMQCPNPTYIAGFNDWKKKFKRTVKAGEKAIRILAPITVKFKTEEVDDEGNKEEKTIEFRRFKLVPVFDYAQTEGEELPTICKPLTASVKDFESLKSALENIAGIPVTYEPINSGANGYYSKAEGKIVIKAGMPEAQTIKTLIHEIAHNILHNDVFCTIPREVKEIQAESTAYMVCKELGIDTDDYTFEYVASWAQMDLKTLTEQMDIVRKTADAIITKLSK